MAIVKKSKWRLTEVRNPAPAPRPGLEMESLPGAGYLPEPGRDAIETGCCQM